MIDPPQAVRWCSLGCGLESLADRARDGKCPRCGSATVDLGWRWRNKRGVFEYASSFETLPKDLKQAA